MSETTTESTNNGASDWAAAAAASAAANAEPEVSEKHFTEILPVKLSDREHKAAYERARDATKKLKAFDAETKALTSERKAKRAELEAAESAAGDVADTGRIEREVPCVERVSWKQNRKWRVRLDTNETFDEQALSDDERQAELPLPASAVSVNGADDEDSDGDVESDDPGSADDSDDPSFDDSTNVGARGPDASSVDVTQPQVLLDGAAPDEDGEATPKKTTRRGRKG